MQGKKFFNNFNSTIGRKGFQTVERVLPISSFFHVLFSFLELESASIQHLQEIHRFNLRFGGVAVTSRFCYYCREFVFLFEQLYFDSFIFLLISDFNF